MPVIEKTKDELTPEKAFLKGRLIEEMRTPHEEELPSFIDNPVIILERSEQLKRIHLTVIWDDPAWKKLELSARCSLAIRAFEEVYPEEAVHVSSSLGTTTDEARHVFGIDLERALKT